MGNNIDIEPNNVHKIKVKEIANFFLTIFNLLILKTAIARTVNQK